MRFRKETPDEVVSILGEGVEMVGEITFAQGLRVDGVLKGKVRSDGILVIGPTGRVEAGASIRRGSISGEFRGTLRASDRVEIHKEGRVYGELHTPCLIIEAGALFEGKCNMAELHPSTAKETPRSQAAGTDPKPGPAGPPSEE